MNREEIMAVIKNLAKSQGFYCRLLESINSADEDSKEDYFEYMESMNFKDPVDIILFYEC